MIECIPNVSEGRRADIVATMADRIRHVPEVRLLDFSSDPAHNRSVFTFAGSAEGVQEAILALFGLAVRHIDLRLHKGEHPRLGAVDVVPFVPLGGASMAECVAVAKQTGAAIADRFDVPVFLYEDAQVHPERRHLEDIRRGGFEGLSAKMQRSGWQPDFGRPAPHPSAGATVVGARPPLIAYNVNLATDRLDVAKRIASTVRQSSGGLPFVKAMGVRLDDRGIVQVSMNLTKYRTTSLLRVFQAVRHEADLAGVAVLESEIIGLVPRDALPDEIRPLLLLRGFRDEQLLDLQLTSGSQA